MSEQNGQERTEQPTEKRKKDSREKGQVARSKELTLLLSLVTAGGGMLILGGLMLASFAYYFSAGLTISANQAFDPAALSYSFAEMSSRALKSFSPFLILAFVSAFFAPMLLGGISFSWKAVQFKVDKINPLSGLKRIFSAQGLSELTKAVLKVILIGTTAWLTLKIMLPELIQMGLWSPSSATQRTLEILAKQVLILSVALIPLVLFDVPFQLWNHNKQLKMTRQEVKDEMKDTEGRPEVKGRIRNLQQQIAQRSLIQSVPTADVVITNPTHFSVALKYDREGSGAPILVAKGCDEMAHMIRRIAGDHQIRICPMPSLARVLYWNVKEGAEIPPLLYVAVAKVLAWVYQVDAGMVENTDSLPEIEIPEEFQKDIDR